MSLLSKCGPMFTDLYELTMAAAYFDHQLTDNASFSLFIRNYPKNRNYFVAAGLENALNELADFTFSGEDIDYLKSTGLFKDDFLLYLKNFKFTGTVRAMAEGTIFFAEEPIIEVSAPIIEAQIVETLLINTIGLQTMIATKSARCIHAASGRSLIDFASRRTQGSDAAVKTARSTYIAGFSGTSNVLAGKLYSIPISGTMAHSFVTAFNNEIDAFKAYATTYPDHSVFLIDTYDTIQGAQHAVKIAKKMKQKGNSLIGVRLDSGDMASLSRKVRKIFDDAGLTDVKIFASSGFDEYKIADIIENGACIDAFGVGTKIGVSADAPYMDIVYKMVRFKDKNIQKLSPGKVNLPGEKQIFRKAGPNGFYTEDIIALEEESFPDALPLLETVMENGRLIVSLPSINFIRDHFSDNFKLLEDKYKNLDAAHRYPVNLSQALANAAKI